MNDIPNSSSFLKFVLFADDTSLLDTSNLSISPNQDNNEIHKSMLESHLRNKNRV